jgi:protein-L-isoaspartate(D-aspartate) O-methyltransferase
MPPGEKGALVGRPIWTGACVIAFSLAAIWYGGDGCSQEAATSQPGAGATAPAGMGPTAAPPTTGPALRLTSAPATGTAAVKWAPPRFTARQRERDAMVAVIRDTYGLDDQAVLSAMSAVPRHLFVPDNLSSRAHDDTPLPIGYGQTISQPYIVAEMTRQLKLKGDSRVLEIGTGSGYQAAVLTEFTPRVYTVEIVEELAKSAAERLKRLGYRTVQVKAGDGYYGWPEQAPFDGIIVTCAAGQIPPPLIEQLARGGRMVIPVGGTFATQSLMLVEKDKEGVIRSRSLMSVRFVPLVRKDGPGK